MLDDVEQAKDVMLGSHERRVKMKGVLAFESSRRAKPMKNAPRCYGLNSMVQQPHNLESPPAPLKTRDNEHDWCQLNVNCYLAATTALNVAAWELQGPSNLLHACREYAEQVNSPRLGHRDNYYWASQQNNCVRPQYIKKEKQLVEQMGHFGGPHKDKNDFTAGLSCALCLSDLSDKPGCEPGRLHFLGVGCWVRLQYMAQIFFSGLLRHGGTSPLVPDEQPMEGWETRMLLISYPATKILTGEARRSFSSMPYQSAPLYITLEMTGAPASQQAKAMWTTHTTYAQDAWVGMEPLSLVNFMARSALQHLYFAFRQLPSSYGVQIDAGQFLKAFSLDVDGHRVNADPWKLAPNSNVGQPFGERHKQVQDELLQKQFNHYLAGIPLVSHNKYHGWDITAINHGARPKCTDDVDEDYDNEDEDKSKDNRKRKANTQDQIDTSKGPNKRGRYCIALQTEVEKRIENDYPMAQSLDSYRSLVTHATAVPSSASSMDVNTSMQGLPPASPALPSGIDQSVTLPNLRQAHNNPVGYQGNHTLPVPRSVPPRGKHLSPMSDDDSEYEDSNAGRLGRSATSPVRFSPEVGVPVRRSSRIVASSLAAKPTVELRAANRMVVELSPFRARDRQHCTGPTSTISDVTSTALSTVTSISRQPRTQAVGVVPGPPLLSSSSLSNMTPLPESPSILPPLLSLNHPQYCLPLHSSSDPAPC
ncbi:hypothetical protein BC835DRAFT_1423272 [Cytidiella melzeri]|nr:hypothetical protein BC835DRAFT_1423272 [Cytidiella melzeri]